MTVVDLVLLLALIAMLAALVASRRQHAREIAQIRTLEREAQERKQYYRTVFAHAGVGILRLDPLGIILEANEAFQDFVGYSYEELKNRPLASVAHPDDREGILADPVETGGGSSLTGQEATATTPGETPMAGPSGATPAVPRPDHGRRRRAERRFIRKDGTWRWADVRVSVVRQADGAFQAFVAVVVDITERKAAELIFQEGQEKLQQITENLGAAVFQLRRRPDGTLWFTYLNEEAERIVGIPRGRLLERAEAFFELIEPPDRAAIEQALQDAERRLDKWAGDFRLRRPDLGLRWLFGRAVPRRTDDGAIVWNGYFSDNTERRQLDQKFRAVFDASFDAYFLIDPRGRALDCNSRAIALFHLSGRDEALTLGPLCFLPETQPDGRRSYDAFLALIAEAMAEGHARREWRFRVRGSEMPAELTIIRLDVAPPPVLLVVVHDLTERKKAEAQLVESRNLLRGVIDNSLAVICAKDLDGRYLLVNRRWGEILDLTEEEVVGRTDAEIFPPDQALDYRRNDLQVLQTRQPLTIEEHAVIDGERRTFLAVKFPIIDRDGQARAVCGISTDITDLKRIQAELHEARQQADAANRAKTQFLANMSHEIRTPMNAILGFAYLALQADPPPRLADYLQKIQSAAKGLLGIINEILDFSKIEVGKLTLERIEFDLERVLDNVAGMITLRAQEKGLELVLAVEPNVPRRLLGDPLRLEQVLVNLTSNAVKFTERGEVIVAVRALPAPAPAAAPLPGATASPAAAGRRPEHAAAANEPATDETPAPPSAEVDRQAPRPTPEPASEPARVILEFQVRDTGVGLTPDQISRLFQPFTQADGSTTRKYGGTGLGLSICKRLVEMMHGTIGVSSEPGRGSTFTFTAEFGLAAAAPAVVPAALPDLRHLSVLVVDDHPASREYLSHVLRSLSFEVIEARDGQEALTILDRRPADRPIELILMDWQMPGLDGIETARRIHGRLGARPAPPPPTIIMVTAFSRDRVMAHASDAPIDEFLVKPVTPSTLFDAILRVFKQEHPQRRPTAPPTTDLPGPDLRRLTGRRVLLVEDNDLNQEVAVSLLTKAGLVVDTATNGREALKRLEAGSYDLVLMDCQMPEMDGYECTAAIRRQPRWTRLPIIAMTANAVAGDRERCLQVGMNDHVAKPIDPATLFGVLARWVPDEEGSPDRANSPQPAPAPAASTGQVADLAAAPASATTLASTAGPLPPTAPSPSREPASVASHPSIVVPAPASTGEAPAPAGPAAGAARAAPEPNARTEPAPRPTTAPPPSSTTPLVAQLERLSGIDLPAALARLGGDAVLLRTLLRKFRSRHLDFGDLVMRAIDQGKWDEARRLAHTLKGVAATVGARGLPDLAAELETILAEHRRAEVTPALMAVQAALLALCAQIDDLPEELGSSPPAGGRRAAATVQPLLDRLMKSLQADDAEAITHFGHLRDALTAWPEVGPDVQTLARTIEAYAFDEAISRLEALAKRLATL